MTTTPRKFYYTDSDCTPAPGGDKERTPMAAHPPQTTTVMTAIQELIRQLKGAIQLIDDHGVLNDYAQCRKEVYESVLDNAVSLAASQNNQGEGVYAVDLSWGIKYHETDLSNVMESKDCRFIGTGKECADFIRDHKPSSPLPGTTVQAEALTVRKFMLKKFPTNKYMDCPIPKHHWGTIQEYAEAYHASLSAPQNEGWVKIEILNEALELIWYLEGGFNKQKEAAVFMKKCNYDFYKKK